MNRLCRKMQWTIIFALTLFCLNACETTPNKPLEPQIIAPLAQEDYGVGYINLQRLINESEIGKVAIDDFLKFAREREAVPAAKLEEVNRLRDILNRKGHEMSHSEMDIKKQEIEKIYKEYQQLFSDARKDITIKKNELISMVLQQAESALKEVAKRMKFSIILKDPNLIAYIDPDVDVTDSVLEEMKGTNQ
ncbi:MAG: OmpH family outer membrane protein [Deltaproteobacteria bacterium]|nr:OmpH family outer membrane protein [Deltaproteobacteria bacterium]